MNSRRFEIRPIASRRLRAALLLVLLLALLGISQTRLSGAEMIVALLTLAAIFADAWRRTRLPDSKLEFTYNPLRCRLTDAKGAETSLRCVRASAYPWLVVMTFEVVDGESAQLGRWLRPIVLLADSLPHGTRANWRRLLVWTHLMRRQLANR